MQCSMCGYEFSADNLACHASCPLAKGCSVICCPNCGYTTVDSRNSRIVRLFQDLAKKLPGQHASEPQSVSPQGMPLVRLKEDQEARVVGVAGERPELLAQLSQYGIVPGTPVRLRQKRPVPIVQIGHTELALDADVAALVYVSI